MNKVKRIAIWVIPLLFYFYVGGYVVYRLRGPVHLHFPRGGGPPGLLISLEQPEYVFLYNLFRPCVWAEDFYYAHERDFRPRNREDEY